MKKSIVILSIYFTLFCGLVAQNKPAKAMRSKAQTSRDSISENGENVLPQHLRPALKKEPAGKVDSMKLRLESAYVWKISSRFGEQIRITEDTARINFHQSSLTDGKDIAVGYLGSLGSPAQSKIFMNRPESSRYIFGDAIRYWRKYPEDQVFRNTKIPYSNIYYQSAGGRDTKEEDFKVEMSSNFGKKINAGFNVDYLYARGFYKALYNKQFNYNLYGSYIGDKYQMHAYVVNNFLQESENGGIKDPLYITNPNAESLKTNKITNSSLDIPVFVDGGLFNRLRARHIYVSNRYNLGEDMEEYAVNDSITKWRKKPDYVSPASIIFTTHYTDQNRRVYNTNTQNDVDSLFMPYYDQQGQVIPNPKANGAKYGSLMNDLMSYYSIKNTLALSMNEGFRSWTKFGLIAFVESDIRRYSIPSFLPKINNRHSDNALFIGGVLSKEKGEFLRYKASGEKDLLNSDFRLQGELTTMLSFKDKDISVKAEGYIKNISPSFFQNNFSSKYKNWTSNFSDIRRVFVGGELNIPFTNTKLSGGVENLQNYIYSGADSVMTQKTGSVQIITLRLDQKLQAGIFHWDTQLAYQATSDNEVVPLPTLSLYTNIYIQTQIAKVLTIQLGADARFHTKYYMPGFDPLTMQFYNQRDAQIGNFPLSTVYVNAHLKNTRFFIMMYNVAQGMGNAESFSLYRYPNPPRMIRMGVSWNFFN